MEESCSFCGKTHTEVKKLIAGPNVFICNECINLSVDIIASEGLSETVERESLAAEPAAKKNRAEADREAALADYAIWRSSFNTALRMMHITNGIPDEDIYNLVSAADRVASAIATRRKAHWAKLQEELAKL
jgi:hypothetical protein